MGLGLKTAANDLVRRFAFSSAVNLRYRWKLLRKLGWIEIEESHIRDGCLFIGYDLKISRGCYFNRQVFIDAGTRVEIGSHVQFGPRSCIVTSTHDIGAPSMRGGTPMNKPVTIDDGCWIGAGAMILPGVHVAEGCIIAAGAVVTKSTEANGLYAGVPARRVKDLPL